MMPDRRSSGEFRIQALRILPHLTELPQPRPPWASPAVRGSLDAKLPLGPDHESVAHSAARCQSRNISRRSACLIRFHGSKLVAQDPVIWCAAVGTSDDCGVVPVRRIGFTHRLEADFSRGQQTRSRRNSREDKLAIACVVTASASSTSSRTPGITAPREFLTFPRSVDVTFSLEFGRRSVTIARSGLKLTPTRAVHPRPCLPRGSR